jgi:glucose-1-phosphate thymidylyltransferase
MEICGVIVVEDARLTAACAHTRRIDAFSEVANRPIAHHVLDIVRSAGAKRIVVVSSDTCAAEVEAQLSTCDVSFTFATQSDAVDVTAGLRLASPLVQDAPCIVHTASGLLGEPLVPYMTRLRTDVPHAIAFVHQGASDRRRLSAATLEMLHVAELSPESSRFGTTGVWLFGPRALSCMATASRPPSPDVDLTTVAGRIENAGGQFEVLLVDTWRHYEGDALDLLELNRVALDNLQVDSRRRAGNGNQIEGRVLIDEQASVRSSVIVGPAVIGPGARIADAYIGPYTSIGAGAHIEGAEIERSIIASGASILHVSGRIVASVVGRDARVFRDFSLPRAMRLRVGDGTEVALC